MQHPGTLTEYMEQQEEQEYIQRILGGEHSVYAMFVDRYKRLAFSIALKVMKNQEDAEDVAQESFIKAYQQLHQFSGKARFSTWLYTIVYRTALRKIRERKGRSMFSITEQFRENFTSDYSTPQISSMQADDERRSVQLAIDRLPETEGLLVMLFYIEEKSVKEIQQIMDLSLANIKIRLFRARKKLERELRFLLDDTNEQKRDGTQG